MSIQDIEFDRVLRQVRTDATVGDQDARLQLEEIPQARLIEVVNAQVKVKGYPDTLQGRTAAKEDLWDSTK